MATHSIAVCLQRWNDILDSAFNEHPANQSKTFAVRLFFQSFMQCRKDQSVSELDRGCLTVTEMPTYAPQLLARVRRSCQQAFASHFGSENTSVVFLSSMS